MSCILFITASLARPGNLWLRSYLVPKNGARVRFSLSINVNTTFLQVLTPCRIWAQCACLGARCQSSTRALDGTWVFGVHRVWTQHYFVPVPGHQVRTQPLLRRRESSHTKVYPIKLRQQNKWPRFDSRREGIKCCLDIWGEYTNHFAFGLMFFCRFLSSSRITVGLYTSFSCIWATTDCITLRDSNEGQKAYVSHFWL